MGCGGSTDKSGVSDAGTPGRSSVAAKDPVKEIQRMADEIKEIVDGSDEYTVNKEDFDTVQKNVKDIFTEVQKLEADDKLQVMKYMGLIDKTDLRVNGPTLISDCLRIRTRDENGEELKLDSGDIIDVDYIVDELEFYKEIDSLMKKVPDMLEANSFTTIIGSLGGQDDAANPIPGLLKTFISGFAEDCPTHWETGDRIDEERDWLWKNVYNYATDAIHDMLQNEADRQRFDEITAAMHPKIDWNFNFKCTDWDAAIETGIKAMCPENDPAGPVTEALCAIATAGDMERMQAAVKNIDFEDLQDAIQVL